MTQRRGSDGDLPPGEGELPELSGPWADVVVPDDPRDLAAEAEQVRAELRARREGPGLSSVFRTRRWRRFGLSGPLVTLVLVVVASFASLVVVILPTSPTSPRGAPLADPSVGAGRVGGLVPPAQLRDARQGYLEVRTVRPAVLLLSPASCATCPETGRALLRATFDARLPVVLVTVGGTPVTLAPDADRTRAFSVADPGGLFTGRIQDASATGPTAVLVRADGTITHTVADVADVGALRSEFAALTV